MRAATSVIALFLVAAWRWRPAACTCVLESDFGFSLNCQFRKSSMFRVRNLGGVKGYVGLGFSVGDELGFRQSLSNVEGNKRRSTDGVSTGLVPLLPKTANSGESARQYMGQSVWSGKSTQLSTVPPFRPIPPAAPLGPGVVAMQAHNDTIRRYAAATVPHFQAMPSSITGAAKAPQSFRTALEQATNDFQTQSMLNSNLLSSKLTHRAPTYLHQGPQVVQVVAANDRSSSVQIKPLPTAIPVANAIPAEKPKMEPSLSLMADTVKSLSAASNLSEETIVAAIALKQQQLLQQQQPKTTTTTTTERMITDVPKKYPLAGPSRVMNAPKEYYPVGYDKNFDDNFVSRVELPDTAFYCGEQKHFPGLYADEDLGCMVFHVCAFTDDGLIMKSFLCPESTLFDQSILKCNWWFYVDCKASKKLYDSNIPVSKSYQLMKALSFFSAYNKPQ